MTCPCPQGEFYKILCCKTTLLVDRCSLQGTSRNSGFYHFPRCQPLYIPEPFNHKVPLSSMQVMVNGKMMLRQMWQLKGLRMRDWWMKRWGYKMETLIFDWFHLGFYRNCGNCCLVFTTFTWQTGCQRLSQVLSNQCNLVVGSTVPSCVFVGKLGQIHQTHVYDSRPDLWKNATSIHEHSQFIERLADVPWFFPEARICIVNLFDNPVKRRI